MLSTLIDCFESLKICHIKGTKHQRTQPVFCVQQPNYATNTFRRTRASSYISFFDSATSTYDETDEYKCH